MYILENSSGKTEDVSDDSEESEKEIELQSPNFYQVKQGACKRKKQ